MKPITLHIATYLAPIAYPIYAAIAAYIGGQLGIRTDIEVGVSFDQFAQHTADIGFL